MTEIKAFLYQSSPVVDLLLKIVGHADGRVANLEATLLVEAHVALGTVQDGLVAAGLTGHLLESLDNLFPEASA